MPKCREIQNTVTNVVFYTLYKFPWYGKREYIKYIRIDKQAR